MLQTLLLDAFIPPSFFYYQKSTMTSIYLISKNLGLIMNAGWQEQIIDGQKEIKNLGGLVIWKRN